MMRKNKGIELWKKAKRIIPGGAQLLSKRSEMFLPEQWPSYFKKAKGVEIWDLEGNKFVDMSLMGVGACILGYSDDNIDRAVKEVVDMGTMTTLNCPEEVELAELMLEIHPWAEMVRYARTGGEAMAIAVRIARARTGKDLILFCGYHGWHDWYLSANLADVKALDGHLLPGLETKGVPRSLRGTAIPFTYNDIDGFLELVEKHKKNIGAIVMEPIRNYYPIKGFLETIKEMTEKLGIVLVFDEITSGWRLNLGGAHLGFSISPDIAVFAKAISNGYPMAAIIGKSEIMEMAQDTFISSTYWTERIGPVAALATIKKLKENNIPQHLISVGKEVQKGWKKLAEKHNLKIKVFGIYPLGHFSFDYENSLTLKTLFIQSMLEKRFLATTIFYASYAHKKNHIKKYLEGVDEAFDFISRAIKKGDTEKLLKGPVCHAGFRRLV